MESTDRLTPIGPKGATRLVNLEAEMGRFFELDDLEFRIGTVTKSGRATVLAYVQNRAIMERLDDVVGAANWRNEFHPSVNDRSGESVVCGISILIDGEWVTKFDVGENSNASPVKGGYSDSMKRAAVQWGIGRYLYYLPVCYVQPEGGKYLPKNFRAEQAIPPEFRPQRERSQSSGVQRVAQAEAAPVADDAPVRKRKLTKADRTAIARAARGKDPQKVASVYEKHGLVGDSTPDLVDVDRVIADLNAI